MFESVYQVTWQSRDFDRYFEAWEKISDYMVKERGALASNLYAQESLKNESVTCLIHSRWPNIDMNKKAWLFLKSKLSISSELFEAQRVIEESMETMNPLDELYNRSEVEQYIQEKNFVLKNKIKSSKKNILIYNDEGCGDSVYQILAMLSNTVDLSECRILIVDANHLINVPGWEETTRLLIIPGGRARPYYTALGAQWENEQAFPGEMRRLKDIGIGNQRIKNFVNNGGNYLGICAGAYYGAERTVFELGGVWEVLDEGALKLFSGTAEGPAYGLGRFKYNSEQGAEVAELSSSQLLYANELDVYFNGGCFFTLEGQEKIPYEQVLACYNNIKKEDGSSPAAIVENTVGKGLAILSGTHFEYFSYSQNAGLEEDIVNKLAQTDEKRKCFQGEILGRLGIPLSEALHNKIYAKKIHELPLLAPQFSENSKAAKFNSVYFDVCESTQAYAEAHENELNDYQVGKWRVVVAEQQTKGQGTHGRSWASPRGNVYATFSTLAPIKPQHLSDVPQIVVIAVMQVLKTFGLEPQYKWVNDVLINDKKISGILCRTTGMKGDNFILHIGIGINVALSAIDCAALSQPATSLNIALGKQVNKDVVIELLKRSLAHHFYCYLQVGRLFMMDELNNRLAFKNQNITFDLEDNKKTVIQGTLLGINEKGWIIIKNAEDNSEQSYYSGRILKGGELKMYMQQKAARSVSLSSVFAEQRIKREHFDKIGSTQDYLRENAKELFENTDRVVVTANEQTKGKGTHNRRWASPPDVNIYATFGIEILPEHHDKLSEMQQQPITTQAAVLAVVKTLREFGFDPKIKWRNDVRLDGKKICGILCEPGAGQPIILSSKNNPVGLIGIGLNVNMGQEVCDTLDQPVTSMKVQGGQEYDKEAVFNRLQFHFNGLVNYYFSHGVQSLLREIQEALEGIGQIVEVRNDDDNEKGRGAIHKGELIGIDEVGCLQLRLEDQSILAINQGQIVKESLISTASFVNRAL